MSLGLGPWAIGFFCLHHQNHMWAYQGVSSWLIYSCRASWSHPSVLSQEKTLIWLLCLYFQNHKCQWVTTWLKHSYITSCSHSRSYMKIAFNAEAKFKTKKLHKLDNKNVLRHQVEELDSLPTNALKLHKWFLPSRPSIPILYNISWMFPNRSQKGNWTF